ncbi:hypothetical protein ACJMK2_007192 [Sinanodonta woodiana]|uniref:Uncharacterized protein n=1 Tax=Sinanodonta woodiana TaxID=1069815 RepID=A0ABD3VJA6_SINWO
MTTSLPPPLKLTSGKRGPSGPLIVTTSDEDSSSDAEVLPQASPRASLGSRISPRYETNVTPHNSLKLDLNHGLGKIESSRGRPLSPTLQQKLAYDAYEHDHDYENAASPSGSSTASGPIYVRPPGFQHHAQEIKKDKVKKKKSLLEFREGLKKRAPTPPKIRARRGIPRKISNLRKCTAKGLLSGDDPYLVDAVSEKMFPQLTIEGARHASSLSGNSSLQLITLREGDKSVTLPSLSIEQNYSQMLSELVMNI